MYIFVGILLLVIGLVLILYPLTKRHVDQTARGVLSALRIIGIILLLAGAAMLILVLTGVLTLPLGG